MSGKLGILLRVLYFALGMCVGLILGMSARATDFPVRKRIPLPASRPEPCVSPEARPLAGQVIMTDQTCPNGMRWRFLK
jgi:hypothetical protein